MASTSIRRAAAQLAGLYANGQTPDDDAVAAARAALQVAKLDRDIRRSQADSVAPDAVRVAHLVGLLLSWGGTPEQRVARLARAIQEAVQVSPELSDADRMAIARVVLAGGDS